MERGRGVTGGRFAREGHRLRFTARRVRVVDAAPVAPELVRVRVTGADLHDFESDGPSDHVRTFVPDPVTGELVAPAAVGPDEDGIIRPDSPTHGRDLTPMLVERRPEGVVLSLDVVLHPNAGPLGAWAASAEPGGEAVLVGPRGTRRVVQDASTVLMVADATALPSAARWARELPAATEFEVVVLEGPGTAGAAPYLFQQSRRDGLIIHSATSVESLMELLRKRGVDSSTFVNAAGEAGAMTQVRRWLRHELQLPREQFAVSGYWKQGEVAFDHHTPLDPDDED
ncbi:MAG TPA: siderophore-interacting protein [Terrimesophilobacter sp.]|nr:siderophore-interacting protein [Terrimesophilobacter sp.]